MKSSRLSFLIGHLQDSRMLKTGRGLISLINPFGAIAQRRKNSSQDRLAVSTNRPHIPGPIKAILTYGYAVALCVGMACFPASVLAQDLGQQPAFNNTMQGESASTVEGTILNIVDWVGNWGCPILGGLSFAHAAVQYKSQRPFMASAAGGVALMLVPGITHLVSYMVQNAAPVR